MRQYIRRGDFREYMGLFAEHANMEIEYEGDADSLHEEIKSSVCNRHLTIYLKSLSEAIGGHAYADVGSQVGFTITHSSGDVYEINRHQLFDLVHGDQYKSRMRKYPYLREEHDFLMDMTGEIVKVATAPGLDIYRSTNRHGAPALYWLEKFGVESQIQLHRAYEIILMNADHMTVNASAGNVWSMLASMVQARQNYLQFESEFDSEHRREFSVLKFMDFRKVFRAFVEDVPDCDGY